MNENLIEAQKDTILGIVNEFYLKGNIFICPTVEPVKENEEVIGIATDYEKAIILAIYSMSERYRKLKLDLLSDTDIEKLSTQSFIDKKTHKTLEHLLWTSIKHRLREKAVKPWEIGIREDWKIVAIEMTKEEKISFDILKTLGAMFKR